MGFASRNDKEINLTVPQVLAIVVAQGPQKVGPRYALNGLRKKIIQQFDRQKSLKQKLEDQNINFYSFDTWEYIGHGIGYGREIKYIFNPKNQRIYKSSWYNLDEIELLLHGLGPVIKSKDGFLIDAIGTLSRWTSNPEESKNEVVKLFITVFDNRIADFSIDLKDFVEFLVQDGILSEEDLTYSRPADFNPDSLVNLLRSYNYVVENLDDALRVVMRLYLIYFQSGEIIDKNRLVKILTVAQQTVEYCRIMIKNADAVFNGSNPY